MSGIPNKLGELPGASGAQLSGKLRQDPHPNPHDSPSSKFCVASIIESAEESSNPSVICHPF